MPNLHGMPMSPQRREALKFTLAMAAGAALPTSFAQGNAAASGGIDPRDRVFITNEDSNTVVVIDPRSNTVETHHQPDELRRRSAAAVSLRHGRRGAHACGDDPQAAVPRLHRRPRCGAFARRPAARHQRTRLEQYLPDRRRDAPCDRQHAQSGGRIDDQRRAVDRRHPARARTARAHLHPQRPRALGHVARRGPHCHPRRAARAAPARRRRGSARAPVSAHGERTGASVVQPRWHAGLRGEPEGGRGGCVPRRPRRQWPFAAATA